MVSKAITTPSSNESNRRAKSKSKSESSARPGKSDRERKVLLGLVELYIQTGKPVGSHTLKEHGFEDLSSATIRNYFAHLEEDGFLQQQHSSGGRIPTHQAFHLYASECLETAGISHSSDQFTHFFADLQSAETREIALFLQQAAELLAEKTHSAVFLSAPRFEHDFILSIKLVAIDAHRCLAALVTDFGEIRTELLYSDKKLTAFAVKRLESYFNWRLTGRNRPENLSKDEDDFAQILYNELLVRFIVKYAHFGEEEVHRTGFSRLLIYPEYRDAELLAGGLSFFENTHGMRLLLKECMKHGQLKFWIGEELHSPASNRASEPLTAQPNSSAVVAAPYYVNQQAVGAVGLLGPVRMPYPAVFALMRQFVEQVSAALTKNLYKFKITLKQPKQPLIDLNRKELTLIAGAPKLLLEDKTAAPKPRNPPRKK